MRNTRLSRNMGRFDRAARAFALAPLALVAALVVGASSFGGIILLAAAGVMLTTSAVGVCPLYIPLGIETRGRAPLPHQG